MTARIGVTPAVVLIDPKNAHNVGGAFRSCAALGVAQLWYTGDRAEADWLARGRVPIEERLRSNRARTQLVKGEGRFLAQFPRDTVIVGVEVHPTAQPLAWFEHPERAVYVFGPEDGTLPKAIRAACHQIVILPTDDCLNLYAAVTGILLDRRLQRQRAGLEPVTPPREMMAARAGTQWAET
jgi:tRNA(Leu) C34 or U34 (ribose-2'-O)-methylase TrmL